MVESYTMKLTLLLLPLVGLAAAGAWWWGGESGEGRVPSTIEPLDEASRGPAVRPETESDDEPTVFAPLLPIDGVEDGAPVEAAGDRGRDAVQRRLVGDPPFGQRQLAELQGSSPETGASPPEEKSGDGPFARHHANGSLAAEGHLRNGKRHGPWVEWYEHGEKKAEGDYHHGDKHGRWSYWHADAGEHESGDYQYGRRENLWTSWYEGGQKESVAYYRNGRKEGRTTLWYPSGQLAAEGQLVDDLREGLWHEWHLNGQLASRGTYHYGRIEGAWEFWIESGTLEEALTGMYERGRKVDSASW